MGFAGGSVDPSDIDNVLSAVAALQDDLEGKIAAVKTELDAVKTSTDTLTAMKTELDAVKSELDTVAANVLAHGTGALNIDGTRIETYAQAGTRRDDGWGMQRGEAG